MSSTKPEVPALPLAGVKVLECARAIAGPVAGWLLAESGAEVVRVELPDGDPSEGHPGFRVVNRGKARTVVDPGSEAGRVRFRSLAGSADVVIVDETEERLEVAGLGYGRLARPEVVWCGLRLFGSTGPRAGLPPDDALVEAASGISAMQWSYGGTPVWLVTPMASYAAGFLASLGIAAALRARAVTGRGQRLDTSGLAGAMLLQSGTYVTGEGHSGSLALQGDDPRGVFPTYGLYRTADGWIFVGALTEGFWASLATLLGRTDLLADPDLPASPLAFGKPEIRDRLRRELEPIIASLSTDEWQRRFEEADVPIGRVQTRPEYLDEPLARSTGAVAVVDDPLLGRVRQPGRPFLLDGGSVPPVPAGAPDSRAAFSSPSRGPARAYREIRAPLEGIRVLDLASFIAGPLCPMLLADLGADVVKVETRQGDPFRLAVYGFEGWNRGKRSLVLDLKKPEGRAAFTRLAASADALVENFRGGVMRALGLGWETLSAMNPRLVYTAITGFGSTGPDAGRPGFDPVMQARSGLCDAQGGDGDPVLHQVAYTDYMAGTMAAFATTAALLEREHTGRGRHVDVSLHRTAFAMQAFDMVDGAPGVKGGRDFVGPRALERLYRVRDGWIALSAVSRGHATALAAAFGLDSDPGRLLAEPPDGAAAARLAGAFASREREALAAELRGLGVPAAPCLDFAGVFTDPHLLANGLVRELRHPRLGFLRTTGEILRFSETPMVTGRPAPALGEHGREILVAAGFSAVEIDALDSTGPSSE